MTSSGEESLPGGGRDVGPGAGSVAGSDARPDPGRLRQWADGPGREATRKLKGPLQYHPPAEHHGHWSITDADGVELACPHTPPAPELVQWLLGASAALFTGPESVAESQTVPDPPQPDAPTPLAAASSRNPALSVSPTVQYRPLPGVLKYLESVGRPFGQLLAIIEDPEFTEPGRRDARVYGGQGLRVVVAPDDTILAAYPLSAPDSAAPSAGGSTSSAGPDTTPAGTTPAGAAAPGRGPASGPGEPGRPRLAGTKADRRRPLPHTVPEFVASLKDFGFRVVPGGKHQKVTHPDYPGIATTLPLTPSDHRWAENSVRDIRHVFGIDVRRSPERSRMSGREAGLSEEEPQSPDSSPATS